MASKISPSVADKADLELPFNFHFLIIKNQYMEDYKPLGFDFYLKTKRWQGYGGIWNSGHSHGYANILYPVYLLHFTARLK